MFLATVSYYIACSVFRKYSFGSQQMTAKHGGNMGKGCARNMVKPKFRFILFCLTSCDFYAHRNI